MLQLRIWTAMADATRVMSRSFVVLCTPVAVVLLGMRVLNLASQRFLGTGAATCASLVMMFVVCYPLSFFANCVVSAMTLRMMERGGKASLSEVLELGEFAGLSGAMLRWVWRLIAWAGAAFGVWILVTFAALVVDAVVAVFLHGAGHIASGGHGDPLSKSTVRWTGIASLFLYVGIISRYAFFIPMVARAKRGSVEILRRGVELGKGYWPVLWISSMADCALTLGMYKLMKALIVDYSVGAKAGVGLRAVDLALVAVLSTWFWIFETMLMQQATAPVDGVLIEELAA